MNPASQGLVERLRGAELVGKGFTSEVYAWNEGEVLKLFHSSVSSVTVVREYKATQSIHAAGLPVPHARELIELDGRQGIVFERIEGISMLKHFQRRPWAILSAARQLAELHARIHRCPVPDGMPSQREWIASNIRKAADITPAESEAALRRLAELPDGQTLCHGDFHPENVLFTSRGPVIIDWQTGTRGHSLGDVACTTRLMQCAELPPWSPRYMHALLSCSRKLLHSAYLKLYLQLQGGTPDQVRAWHVPLEAAAKAWRRQRGAYQQPNAN